MAISYCNWSLAVLLLSVSQAFAYEVCKTTIEKTYYCDDGYYCCNDNTQCCEDDGLGVGVWVGIVIGIIVFKIILISLCVRWCRARRYNRQPVYVARQPVVTTIASSSNPPPYTSLGNAGYKSQVGYSTNVTTSPPPAYSA